MEAPSHLDLAAAARVAKRVELRDIKLSEVSAARLSSRQGGLITPDIQHECSPTTQDGGYVEVLCSYKFLAIADEAQIAKADFKYLISYKLIGDEPVDGNDLEHFAFANGTYHSWPFVRQLIYDLTSRMGYPPYTLPVFQFNPKPKPVQETVAADGNEEEDAATVTDELAETTE